MSDRLTAAQLAEIEARHTAATGGEWFYDPDEPSETVSTTHGTIVCRVLTAADFPCVEEGTEDDVNRESAATAAFIAAAHQDIPALLRDLRAAREALEESAAQFEHYERLHREKRTTDDNLKALVNWGFAQFARAALPEETPSGE